MYRTVIGLEIHVELKTKSKMFCSCSNDPMEHQPNVNICPVCLGHPGTLPVINEEAVRKVIKAGLALNCKISEYSKFDRKQYFYPDLPKGYQISQYDMPLCNGGYLEIDTSAETPGETQPNSLTSTPDGARRVGSREIKLTRIHLEEDTGRLIHPEGENYSLVDFNRAGVPLMELVTEPDIKSAKEARRFAEELQLILRYLEVSDADMEKGQMRCEVNISIHKIGEEKLGTKVEIKNLNSFQAVEGAVECEIKRQSEILEKGKKVIQETRGWDDKKEITFSQRAKEEAHEYRYFPEPDLPTLHLETAGYIDEIKAEISELPQQRRKRFKREYRLSSQEIEFFVFYKDLGEYFEKATSELRNWVKEIERKERVEESEFFKLAKLASNYIITDLQSLLKKASVAGDNFLITPENFAEFITLIYERKISSKIAKIVLGEMFKTGADPSHVIKEKKLSQLTDENELEKITKEIILKNPKAAADFKNGKENVLQFLVGQIMARTRGRANPQIVRDLLEKNLR